MQQIVYVGDNDFAVREPTYDELKEALERSRRLTLGLDELARHLQEMADLDELYQQAIVLGRSVLGIDRIGIHLIDPNREWLTGTFGTDEDGRLCDEREQRVPFPSYDQNLLSYLENRDFLVVRSNDWIYHKAQRVGKGWTAFYAFWDGVVPVGIIACDNLLTGRPIEFFTAELYGMYASEVGSLILRKRHELEVGALVSAHQKSVARTAHEINTPLGAIVSAASSVADLLWPLAVETAPFYAELTPSSRLLFDTLVAGVVQIPHPGRPLSRETRRRFVQELERLGQPEPVLLAAHLETLGFPVDVSAVGDLIAVPRFREVLEHVTRIADIHSATSVIAESAEKSGRYVKELLKDLKPSPVAQNGTAGASRPSTHETRQRSRWSC